MSGNVGSERRLEYTAVGDTVNTAVAARGADQGVSATALLDLRVDPRAPDAVRRHDLVFVDEITLRGRSALTQLWTLAEHGRTRNSLSTAPPCSEYRSLRALPASSGGAAARDCVQRPLEFASSHAVRSHSRQARSGARAGTLVLSTDPAYPPQSRQVKGAKRLADTKCAENQMTANQMTGYDVDTGKLVAKGLGVEACFVTPTWTEITAGQWGDRWDLAYGSGAINSDRMQRLWMTTPYRSEPQRYFVQKKSPYQKPADLDGKEIGVCDSCTVEFYLRGAAQDPGSPAHGRRQGAQDRDLRGGGAGPARPAITARSTPTSPPRPSAWRRFTRARSSAAAGRRVHDVPDGLPRQELGAEPGGVRREVDQIVGKAQRSGALKALSLKYFGKDYATHAADYDVAKLHQKIPLGDRR